MNPIFPFLVLVAPLALVWICDYFLTDEAKFHHEHRDLPIRDRMDLLRMRESTSRITRLASEAVERGAHPVEAVSLASKNELAKYADRPDLAAKLNPVLDLPYTEFLSTDAQKATKRQMDAEHKMMVAMLPKPDIDRRNAYRTR